ncbi:MAG TPA: immunoglobulin domain-containing protein, partial [Candidatus Acidoferrales bacterium]|nr:immunoglobulin domain-containing protein [Candidatus Acidoferrales bacterium]
MKTITKIKAVLSIGCLLVSARGFAQSDAPVITQDVTNLTVIAGQNAILTVGVAATNGPFTYQWQSSPVGAGIFSNLVDGGQISGSGLPSLTIDSVTPANAADFRAIVANTSGSTTSSVATLTVWAGYTLNLAPGLTLIANQLDHGNNTLNEIMPSVPDGTILYKFNNSTTNWSEAYFSSAIGVWLPPGITLNPGEGAFIQSPTNFALTFTGAPNVPSLPVNIPDGACYLLSRQTNDIGNYLNIVGAPPGDGATIYQWNGSAYTSAESFVGTWSSGGSNGPASAVGQALWISPSGGSAPPALAVPPLMVSLPQPAMLVGMGSNAVLSAT